MVRILFNECHTIMDSTPVFRPQMQQLGVLATREVQMMFLTDTLSLQIEPEFIRFQKIQMDEV